MPRIRCAVLAAIVLSACNGVDEKIAQGTAGDSASSAQQSAEGSTVALPSPAQAPRPDRSTADSVLSRFATKLLAGDMASAKEDLKIPPGYNDKQIRFFLAELRDQSKLTESGLSAVLASDFGPLQERFPDSAAAIAFHAKIEVTQAYAFGDKKAAALLHWDGTRFRVAALHNLSKIIGSE